MAQGRHTLDGPTNRRAPGQGGLQVHPGRARLGPGPPGELVLQQPRRGPRQGGPAPGGIGVGQARLHRLRGDRRRQGDLHPPRPRGRGGAGRRHRRRGRGGLAGRGRGRVRCGADRDRRSDRGRSASGATTRPRARRPTDWRGRAAPMAGDPGIRGPAGEGRPSSRRRTTRRPRRVRRHRRLQGGRGVPATRRCRRPRGAGPDRRGHRFVGAVDLLGAGLRAGAAFPVGRGLADSRTPARASRPTWS